jgi:hypothetical protein
LNESKLESKIIELKVRVLKSNDQTKRKKEKQGVLTPFSEDKYKEVLRKYKRNPKMQTRKTMHVLQCFE